MVQVPKYGQMAPNMKENGSSIKLMARESSGMRMATSMRVTGKMTRPTASASTSTSTEQDTRVSGRTICKTAGELSPGPMAASTRAATRRE
jgi:hypothetical protein